MNPYFVFITLGGSIALILSVIGKIAPAATKGVLPLGGTDFNQTAIVLLSAIALAAVADLWDKRRK